MFVCNDAHRQTAHSTWPYCGMAAARDMRICEGLFWSRGRALKYPDNRSQDCLCSDVSLWGYLHHAVWNTVPLWWAQNYRVLCKLLHVFFSLFRFVYKKGLHVWKDKINAQTMPIKSEAADEKPTWVAAHRLPTGKPVILENKITATPFPTPPTSVHSLSWLGTKKQSVWRRKIGPVLVGALLPVCHVEYNLLLQEKLKPTNHFFLRMLHSSCLKGPYGVLQKKC